MVVFVCVTKYLRNPLFVKTGWGKEGDYHLRDGSPAIDRGTPNGAPNIDLDGNPRPLGSGYDIGCYER
ncbi:MAG: choice-of-anchor Q domain-containing protein [candidate division WOR-3 bacterium]